MAGITDQSTPRYVAVIGLVAIAFLVLVHRGFAGVTVQVGS